MMKKALLAAAFLGWSTLALAEKKDYQVSQNNDDAEENASSGSMNLGSSDLELISEGGTDQLVGIRFQSIEIPQGATIISAFIEFETDETDSGATSLTIQGEDIDDAPTFNGMNSNISNRTRTTASVAWNSIPAWNTVSERHLTPDLTSIVQEIVDRGGWSSGNDMVFIITGSGERTAESHNGESANAPILRIEIAGLTPTPGASLCYGAADSGNRFVIIDVTDGTVDTNVGALGASSVEAIAIDPNGLDVYGADRDELGRIDTNTGEFIRLIESFGTGGGSAGNINFDDVDSLAFDHDTGTLWGVDARGGSDALFQIDPDTGAHVPDAFGVGIDYVLITGTGIGTSIDDIAIDTSTGTMYGSDTTNSQLITINTTTGAGTVVGSFGGSIDMEGMGFHFDGTLYGTEGQRVYTVNTSTGAATQVGSGDTLTVGDDYEGFDCHFTALTRAVITRFDATRDGDSTIVEWETASEDGTAGFYLYRYDYAESEWILTHDALLPGLLSSPQGGSYRLVDRTAGPETPLLYALVEVEVTGRVRTLGLYAPRVGDPSESPRMTSRFERRARRTTARVTRRTVRTKFRALRHGSDVKLRAGARGIYYVDAARVADALGSPGLAFWVAAEMAAGRVALTRRGKAIAWLPAPDGSGFYFYAQGIDSIYGVDDIYRLSFRPGHTMARLRLPASGTVADDLSFSAHQVFEEDRFPATVVALDPEADYWFWEFVSAGSTEFGRRHFTLNVPRVADGSASLEVRLFGATSTGLASEHRVRVRFNGIDVGTSTWSGIGAHELSVDVPAGLLQAGDNDVEIEAVLDSVPYSIIYVDGFSLHYQRRYDAVDNELVFRGNGHRAIALSGFTSEPMVFDITRPHVPRHVTLSSSGFVPPRRARDYIAVASSAVSEPAIQPWVEASPKLGARANRADYLVIAPDELVEAASLLADYRAAQGLTTMIVGLSTIENEFQHGFRGPEAIRQFLRRARRWQSAPRYVVLLGEGSLDYRNLLGHADSLVPPLLRRGTQGIFVSDNALGANKGSSLPAMAIGRIPVVSEDELASYVDKIRNFETGARLDELLILSDAPDIGGEFAIDSERMAATLDELIAVESISLEHLPVDLARVQLFAKLRAGTGLVTYSGHGGLDRLSSAGLLTSADVASLDDATHASILVSLSCSTNRFDIPGFDSLGEVLVRQAQGGAVAVWAPVGLTAHGQSIILGQIFLERAFDSGQERLGDAVLGALRDYARLPDSERLVQTFNLLGDPALVLPR